MLTRMRDRCVFVAPGRGAYDPATNTHDTTETVVYDGPCAVQPTATGSDVQTGGLLEVLNGYTVLLPLSADNIEPGHWCRVTQTSDPRLAGQRLVARSVQQSTDQLARKVFVEDPQYRERP
jgi:hypothetical protein